MVADIRVQSNDMLPADSNLTPMELFKHFTGVEAPISLVEAFERVQEKALEENRIRLLEENIISNEDGESKLSQNENAFINCYCNGGNWQFIHCKINSNTQNKFRKKCWIMSSVANPTIGYVGHRLRYEAKNGNWITIYDVNDIPPMTSNLLSAWGSSKNREGWVYGVNNGDKFNHAVRCMF